MGVIVRCKVKILMLSVFVVYIGFGLVIEKDIVLVDEIVCLLKL